MLKSLVWSNSKGPIIYPKRPFLLLVPFTAFSLLKYVEKFEYMEALLSPNFYIAWLASSLIMGVVLYTIHWITVRLDAHYPWHKEVETRIEKQSLAGILLPLLLAFGLATIYFAFFAINIFNTIWFTRYLVPILVLLVATNLFYGFYGSFQEEQVFLVQPNLARREVFQNPEALVDGVGEEVEVCIPEIGSTIAKVKEATLQPEWALIACIFACNKHTYCMDFDGELLIWKHNLKDSEQLLPDDLFFAVNRGFLINFGAIEWARGPHAKITFIQLLPALTARIKKTYEIAAEYEHSKLFNQQAAEVIRKVNKLPQALSEGYQVRLSYEKKAKFMKDFTAFEIKSKQQKIGALVPNSPDKINND